MKPCFLITHSSQDASDLPQWTLVQSSGVPLLMESLPYAEASHAMQAAKNLSDQTGAIITIDFGQGIDETIETLPRVKTEPVGAFAGAAR